MSLESTNVGFLVAGLTVVGVSEWWNINLLSIWTSIKELSK